MWDSVIPDRVSPSPAYLLFMNGSSHEEPPQRDSHGMMGSFRFCETNSSRSIAMERADEIIHSFGCDPSRDLLHISKQSHIQNNWHGNGG
jgi:hypothetical protein